MYITANEIEITNFLCKTNYYWWISVFMWRRDGIGFYAQTYINEYKWMRCHAKCDRIVKICEPKHSLNYMWSRLAIRFGFSHSHNSFGSTHIQQIIVSNHNTSLQYCMTARCVCVAVVFHYNLIKLIHFHAKNESFRMHSRNKMECVSLSKA